MTRSHVTLRHYLLGSWWWGAREAWSSPPFLSTSSTQSLHPSSMSMVASGRGRSLCSSSVWESLSPILPSQMLYSSMHLSSSTMWCGHLQALWLTSQLAWGIGLNVTTPKHLFSFNGTSKSLPKTTRGREEPGTAPQSTTFH